jgi:molybdate transport repressor ModE-like protein
MNIELHLAWSLVGKHREPFNPELIALLDGIANGGNLRYAARAAKLSYRHAWGVIKYWEQYFGHTLVALVRGRGAVLTTAGETLRDTWHRTNERAHAALQDAATFAERSLETLTRQQEEGAVTIVASHGLGVTTLADLLRGEQIEVDLQLLGSEQSLERYAAGACRVAGFHLPEGILGARLWRRFQPRLDAKRDVLLLVESRELGFMTKPGANFGGIRDIAKRKLRFVNRQPGAGSRLVFDLLLADAGIKPAAIPGYHHEEYTHLAVAAMVAAGDAHVAFGTRAAAERFGLDFHREVNEKYLLAVPREDIHRKPCALLQRLLGSTAYKRALAASPGCDTRGSGKLVELKQVATLAKLAPAARKARSAAQ